MNGVAGNIVQGLQGFRDRIVRLLRGPPVAEALDVKLSPGCYRSYAGRTRKYSRSLIPASITRPRDDDIGRNLHQFAACQLGKSANRQLDNSATGLAAMVVSSVVTSGQLSTVESSVTSPHINRHNRPGVLSWIETALCQE